MSVKTAPVSELSEQIRGVTFAKSDAVAEPADGFLPVLRAGNITDNGVDFEDLLFVPADRINDRQMLRANDVLIAASSGSLSVVGKAARMHKDFGGGFGAFCKVLRPNQSVDPGYFSHYFQTGAYRRKISSLAAGANINNLRGADLDGLRIPLPPLPEQRRIAEILDRADALRAKRRQAIAKLDSLTQSIFIDMFGDPARNPKGFQLAALGQLGRVTSSRRIYKSEYTDSGVPFYRTKEVKEKAHRKPITAELFISHARFEEIRKAHGAPQEGDILVTAIGTIGEIYVVDHPEPFYFKDGNVLWLRDFDQMNPAYLRTALAWAVGALNRSSRGSTYAALSIDQLAGFEVLVPPRELQDEYQRRCQLQTSLRASLVQADDCLEQLCFSLQHRAFRSALSESDL